jgi:hypothetical protein
LFVADQEPFDAIQEQGSRRESGRRVKELAFGEVASNQNDTLDDGVIQSIE